MSVLLKMFSKSSFLGKNYLFINPVTIFSPTSFFMLSLYPKKQRKR